MFYCKLFTCTNSTDGKLGKRISFSWQQSISLIVLHKIRRYFDTLDITLDRAGYYICWGCLVWVPAFYTFNSYFFVYYQPNCGSFIATIILVLGVLSIYLNYEVDRQKEIFRASSGKVKVSLRID